MAASASASASAAAAGSAAAAAAPDALKAGAGLMGAPSPPKPVQPHLPPLEFGGDACAPAAASSGGGAGEGEVARACRYRRGEELGAGGFGRVFRCWRRSASGVDEQAFAVKVISLRRLRFSPTAEKDLINLKREAGILKSLPAHPQVVSFFDSVEDQHWLFLVLELVSGGDLLSNLRALGRRCLEEQEASFVLRQLTDGLAFLHGRGVVHRDLKPENVLVASVERQRALRFFRVKISDFGLSKAVGEGLSECRSAVGTRRYVAPEVLTGGTYDCRVDLWSLGVLMYLLLEGSFPHDQPARAPQAALDAAVAKAHVGKPVKALLSGLLRLEPARRLCLAELGSHPWLQQQRQQPSERLVREESGVEDPLALRRLTSSAGAVSTASAAFGGLSSVGSRDFSALLAVPFAPGAPAHSAASAASLLSGAGGGGAASTADLAGPMSPPPPKRPRSWSPEAV